MKKRKPDPIKLQHCAYLTCRKIIPAEYGPGVSLSRADNKTLICSSCGTGEALLPRGALTAGRFDPGLRLPKFMNGATNESENYT
jgi:hypothetical protein